MEKYKYKTKVKEKLLIIFFSIAFAFSFCIFNQFDVFFRNQIEFGIQPQEIAIGFIIYFFITLFISILALFLIIRRSKKIFKIVLAIIIGLMLASYAQVLFLNGYYNGAFENFAGKYKPVSIWIKLIDLVIWLVICLFPLFILYLEEKKHKDFFKRFIFISSISIFIMQFVGFGTAVPYADFDRYDKSFFFSVDKQLDLSIKEKENIVVFILDRCATGYVDEVFTTYPAAKDNFKGFTYFQNNEPEYDQTFPSVISMLTGTSFEKTDTRENFSKNAWANETLFKELRARDYTINTLLDELSTYYSLDDIYGKFDNIEFFGATRKVNQLQAINSMSKLSLQRTLPYIFKNGSGFKYPDDLNAIVGSDITGFFPNKVGQNSDKRFTDKIDGRGLSANNQKNTFSFVHLDCSHTNKWRQVTYNTFNMLGRYFDQMKELGIYENSTIILTADHGAGGYGRKASLFIKEKGNSNSNLIIDNTTKLSNGFFLSTIFELIGANDKKTTTSYFDIIHRGITGERYHYNVSWNVDNQCTFYSKTKID